jgi:hypothetical protein
MFKSTITRYAAAAFIGAALTFGATNLRANETYTPHYLVFNRVNTNGTWNCTTTFDDHTAQTLALYTQDVPNEICVIKTGLSVDGVEQLPEQLDNLVGILPATGPNNAPVSLDVYLPQINGR